MYQRNVGFNIGVLAISIGFGRRQDSASGGKGSAKSAPKSRVKSKWQMPSEKQRESVLSTGPRLKITNQVAKAVSNLSRV